MGAVHHQTEPHSYGRGMPLGHRYAVAPVDGPQASSDQSPVGFCSLFDVSSLNLAGVRPGPFSSFSFAGVNTREGDRLNGPLLPCWAGRHKFLTPAGRRLSASYSARLFAGFIPQRKVPCTDPRHQLASNLTDGSRAFHRLRRLSWVAGSDVDHSTRRIPRNVEKHSQGRGNV